MSYHAEVMADTPVAYWRMNDTSGNPQDSSGNAHHVTAITGTPTYSQTSPITSDAGAKAINLPSGAYMSVPDSDAWDVDVQAITIEAWIKRDSTSSFCNILSKQTNGWGMKVDETDDKLHFQAVYNAEVLVSTTTMNDTSWHHVVSGYDVGSTAYQQWVDGVDAGASRLATPFYSPDANAVIIGALFPGEGNYGQFTVAELAVYIMADIMTTARVAAHYAAATATAAANKNMLLMGAG